MKNYWDTNHRAGQGGSFIFGCVLTSAEKLDPAALTKMGWESMQPVALDHVIERDKVGDPDKPLPPPGATWIQLSNQNIVLVTRKLAENGNGTILRLLEPASQPRLLKGVQ